MINNEIRKCEKGIKIDLKPQDNLKALIDKTAFKSNEEQIQFFKEIKSQLPFKFETN